MYSPLEQALNNGTAPWKNIEYRCKEFWIFADGHPVTDGHLLFVPIDLTMVNLVACYEAAYKWGYDGIQYEKWDAFNIGQNIGIAAGQSVAYPHVHMIPRRTGDVENPRGGVRYVIPDKGNYQ